MLQGQIKEEIVWKFRTNESEKEKTNQLLLCKILKLNLNLIMSVMLKVPDFYRCVTTVKLTFIFCIGS